MEAVVAVAVAVQARVDDCEIDLERREGLGKVCSERQTERASSDPAPGWGTPRCVVIQDEIALWWRPWRGRSEWPACWPSRLTH